MAKGAKLKSTKRDSIPKGGYRIQKASKNRLPKSILLFGQWKRGKSTLAASAAEVYDNVLFIDIDEGDAAFAEEFPDVDTVHINKGDVAAFEKLWAEIVKNDGLFNGVQYDVIVIDTLSILHGWKLDTLDKGLGWDRMTITQNFTIGIMWALHRMSPLGIATFHTELADTMRGSTDDEFRVFTPSLTGKEVKRMLGPIPDIIGFCDIIDDPEKPGEPLFTVTLKPTETTMTGNRFRRLPSVLGNPTIRRMWDYIEGKV